MYVFAIMVMFTYTSYRLYHSISKALSHMFFVLYALLIRSVFFTLHFFLYNLTNCFFSSDCCLYNLTTI